MTPSGSGGRTILAVALVAALLPLLASCDSGTKAETPVKTAPAATVAQPSSPAADKPAAPTEGPSGRIADEPVAVQTEDGITVRGHLYSTAGPKRQAVILAHEHGANQTVWSGFARELAGMGIASLTLDLRGHGETGGAQDVPHVDRDVAAMLLLLQSRDYPQIYLIGASLGGMASVRVAATRDVAGVVTISSPVSYMGLDLAGDVPRVTEKKLFLGSKADTLGGPEDVQEFMRLASSPKESFLFDGAAHGTALFNGPNAAALRERLTAFVRGQ